MSNMYNQGIMKKLLIFLSLLFSALIAYPQETTPASFWDDPFSHPLFPFYMLMLFIFIVILLVLAVALYMIKVLRIFIERTARERAEKMGVPYVAEPSWWNKLQQRLTRSTPVEKEEVIMLDHNYDGIRELDNHLPPWWKWLFYGTIVWAAIYLVLYHVTQSLPLSTEEYQAQVADFEKLRSKQPLATIDENALEFTHDQAIIDNGKKIFSTNCGSCHRSDGGGDVGPNLTDNYWLYGGSIKNIFATIKNGKPENGMISWAAILKPEEIRDVAYYVMSIRGQNPPNPKAPQGTLNVEGQDSQQQKTDSVSITANL